MFKQAMATAGTIGDGHQYQEEAERGKGNIFYATDGSRESVLLADEFIFGDHVDAQITLNTLGISGILARKRQGFNVLFCDFCVLDSVDYIVVMEVIKKFTKKLPDMPIFIFCSSQEQYRKACSFLHGFVKNIFLKSSDNLQSFIASEIQDFLKDRAPVPV